MFDDDGDDDDMEEVLQFQEGGGTGATGTGTETSYMCLGGCPQVLVGVGTQSIQSNG